MSRDQTSPKGNARVKLRYTKTWHSPATVSKSKAHLSVNRLWPQASQKFRVHLLSEKKQAPTKRWVSQATRSKIAPVIPSKA